jgi:hypothetical protein
MEIKTPDAVREIKEVSYTWDAGMSLELLIDETAGDSITDMGECFQVRLAAKPLISNPDEKTGAEDVLIYKRTLASVITRTRSLRVPTPEEIFDLQQTLHPMVPRVQ